MKILVVNSGSSTFKCSLFDTSVKERTVWHGQIVQYSREKRARIKVEGRAEEEIQESRGCEALQQVVKSLWRAPNAPLSSAQEIEAVGHRIVHGGEKYTSAAIINAAVKADIEALAVLAPAHHPRQLETVAAMEDILPSAVQAAVFDTAFHSTMPESAATYPVPLRWKAKGVRRFGFHGINHKYCAGRAAQLLGAVPEKLVTCHLGNGCSLAAIKDGRSINTTMGFTPLEGLMMGSRSGSIDPAIPLYLIRHEGMSAAEVEEMLNFDSGLRGISGGSGDMVDVLERAGRGEEGAKLALEMYVHSLAGGVAKMAASLGGIDALVFTGGVGENAQIIREMAAARLRFLGVEIDSAIHTKDDRDISASGSRVRVLVIKAREDLQIARECQTLLTGKAPTF